MPCSLRVERLAPTPRGAQAVVWVKRFRQRPGGYALVRVIGQPQPGPRRSQQRLAATSRAISLRHAAIVLLFADREATFQAPDEVVLGRGVARAAGQQPPADGSGHEPLQNP